jgi:hypothetical protein
MNKVERQSNADIDCTGRPVLDQRRENSADLPDCSGGMQHAWVYTPFAWFNFAFLRTLPRFSSQKRTRMLLSQILVALIALEHLYILWLEMFAWETTGKKVFKGAMRAELFAPTKVLAANQGLYNGFLAAGLWLFFS